MRTRNRFAYAAGEWLQVIGLGLLMIALCFMMFSAVLMFFGVILAIVACFWAIGYPITVKNGDGKQIGYLRWFTFHRT